MVACLNGAFKRADANPAKTGRRLDENGLDNSRTAARPRGEGKPLRQRLCLLGDCRTDAIQQIVSQPRFFDDQNRNCRGSVAHLVGWIAGDENGRNQNSPTAQGADQLQSIHCGHVVVDDQAPDRRQARIVEQVMAIGKGANLETLTLHHIGQGIPDGIIVIDDEDDLLGRLQLRHHQISFAAERESYYYLDHESSAAALIHDKTCAYHARV